MNGGTPPLTLFHFYSHSNDDVGAWNKEIAVSGVVKLNGPESGRAVACQKRVPISMRLDITLFVYTWSIFTGSSQSSFVSIFPDIEWLLILPSILFFRVLGDIGTCGEKYGKNYVA